jgi:tripartite-type tricarboxylate transporter receptor subunit TctC
MRKTPFAGLCLLALAAALGAQPYPTKPVRIVIPFPPGGASDILARTVARHLSDEFKQQFIVENRAGAGGLIAIETAAKSSGDGHTLLQIATSFVINPSLYRRLPYDPERDFVPISILAIADNIVVVHPSLPVKSVAELVKLAKGRPGELNYAHSGSGTQAYLAAELFKQTVQVDIVAISYKGTPAALLDVISGQVHLMFAGAPPALPHIQTGKLRAVAVTGKERLPELPTVPTVAETLPGFEAAVWYGLLAPAGTPHDVVIQLNAAVNRGLRVPDVKERLARAGFRTLLSTPDEFASFMKAEGAKWARVIRESGTRPAD